MNGQLALAAALAAIGGRWLRAGEATSPPALSATNTSFQYVSSFSTRMPPRGLLRRSTVVTSPEDWLLALRDSGVSELSLITDLPRSGPLAAHVASAFSNSGTWAILATGQEPATLWHFSWDIGDRDDPAHRIWSITASHKTGEGLRAPSVAIQDARTQLLAALQQIQVFVERHDEFSSWAPWFTKSEQLLDDPTPAPPYHGDLLPSDARLDRRQLAPAVVQGWVFGGMGSWNDGGCSDAADQREYERVGADLYAALLAALPAAANGA